jgi:ABC-2 type transport system permease protein
VTDSTPALPRFAPGTFAPQPGRATMMAMVRAAAAQELRIMARNAEQSLLAYVIPLAALIGMTVISVGSITEPRVDTVTPGILALAIMSSSFTSQAIMTGFDRRYGVMKRLAATGFPRWLLLASKCAATLVVIAAQFVLLCLVAYLGLGWQPRGNPLWVAVLTLLGVAAFIGLALLLGGTLRAEAVLGIANLVWLILIGVGGVLIPLTSAPAWLETIGGLTPAGALANGLRAVLTDGGGPGTANVVVLGCWVVAGWAGTVRWFRWQ